MSVSTSPEPFRKHTMSTPFWRSKPLEQMTPEEWESLCDRCGKCCLYKLEDEENGRIYYTNVVCSLLDFDSGRCTRYTERSRVVPGCLTLSPEKLPELHWMPGTCAYRLLAEGEELPEWHPLLSGDPESVQRAGVSVRSYAVPDSEVSNPDELHRYIIEWLE